MGRTDKELADELDAQDRLFARGYECVLCSKCGGAGWARHPEVECPTCNGRGHLWKTPISK